MTKNRICIAVGPWQLISLLAALESDNRNKSHEIQSYLLLGANNCSPALKDIMSKLASLGEWQSIVWINELFDSPAQVTDESLLIKMMFDNVDEIWTSIYDQVPQKRIFDLFRNANLVIFEEGVLTYHGVSINKKRNILQHVSMFMRSTRNKLHYLNSLFVNDPGIEYIRRCRYAVLYLTNWFDTPSFQKSMPITTVEPKTMQRILTRAYELLNIEAGYVSLEISPGNILVLGQAFSHFGLMEWDKEYGLFRYISEKIISSGYKVLWKEHPRMTKCFGEALKNEFADQVSILDMPHSFPIEILGNKLSLAGCATIASSAAVYLHFMYNIPAYTIAPEIMKSFGVSSDWPGWLSGFLPTVDDLPILSK